MFSDDPRIPAGPLQESCPVDDVLRRYLAGELPPEQEASCGQHIDRCGDCRQRAEALTDRSVWTPAFDWLPPTDASLQPSNFEPECEPSLFLTPPEPQRVTSETRTTSGSDSGGSPSDSQPAKGLIPRWRELEQRFEIRETVGVGGCGTVFRAWDLRLHRQVALKVPHWPLFAQEGIRQRFEVEAKAAARLSHPNIVPIFEAQIDAEVCFLASEFVEGRSLAAWLADRRSAQRPIPCLLAASLVRELAIGVESAHSQGILHRDLKPANVLLDSSRSHGNLAFVPRITDFGLARLSEEAGPTTVEGSVIGSLPYMSPEQAAGGGPQLDAGCDIYSLGVILYETLTGRVPILGTSPANLLQNIASELPTAPRRLRPEIRPDLQAICLKCLEKRPQDRYRSAGDLAADLGRFLAGETVIARRPSLPEQLIRWVRRHPTATTVVAANFTALAAIAIVLAVANRQLNTLNDDLKQAIQLQQEAISRADELRGIADRQRKSALEKLYVAEVRRAVQAWQDHDLPELQRVLDRLSQEDFEAFRGLEWRWLRSLLNRSFREVTALPDAVYAVGLSGSGDVLAVTGKSNLIRLVDFRTGETIREWPTEQRECNDVLFTDGDRVVWSTGDDGSLCQWEVATGRLLHRLAGHAPDQAHNLLAVPDEDLLISAGTDGKVRLWSLTTGAERGVLDAHSRAVTGMNLLPDKRRLFTLGLDDQAALWDLASGQSLADWSFGDQRLRGCMVSQDGLRLFAATGDRRVDLFELSSRRKLADVQLLDVIDCLVLAPDGKSVFAADRQGVIHSIPDDPAGFQNLTGTLPVQHDEPGVVSLVRAHSDRIFDLQLTADGSELISASADGRVRSWPVSLLTDRREVFRSPVRVENSACRPNNPVIFAFTDTALQQFDAQLRPVELNGRPPGLIDGAKSIGEATLSPGGRLISVEVDERGKRNWLVNRDPVTWQPTAVWPFSFAAAGVNGIEFDGLETLAVIRRHSWNELQLIELSTGREQPPLVYAENLSDSATSPRSGLIAVSAGHRVEVLEPRSRQVRWSDDSLPQAIMDLKFSDDGRHLAAACSDRAVWIWDVASGRLMTQLTGHRQEVTAITFAPDGRSLISGDSTGLLKFWRPSTGDHLFDLQLNLPGKSCAELQVNPATRLLVIRDDEGWLSGLSLGRSIHP